MILVIYKCSVTDEDLRGRNNLLLELWLRECSLSSTCISYRSHEPLSHHDPCKFKRKLRNVEFLIQPIILSVTICGPLVIIMICFNWNSEPNPLLTSLSSTFIISYVCIGVSTPMQDPWKTSIAKGPDKKSIYPSTYLFAFGTSNAA